MLFIFVCLWHCCFKAPQRCWIYGVAYTTSQWLASCAGQGTDPQEQDALGSAVTGVARYSPRVSVRWLSLGQGPESVPFKVVSLLHVSSVWPSSPLTMPAMEVLLCVCRASVSVYWAWGVAAVGGSRCGSGCQDESLSAAKVKHIWLFQKE